MSASDPNRPHGDPVRFLRKAFDLAHGALDNGEQLSPAEIRADLKQMGIDSEKGWAKMQTLLNQAEGKLRLAEAREGRLKAAAQSGSTVGGGGTEESLIAQIKGFLSLSGQAAVYARKWESSSIEDLKSLRDKLAKTAARAAERKDAGK